MWLLLIIFLVPTVSGRSMQELHSYATKEECQTERNRIGFEMAKAYPYEHNFDIICESPAKVP